MNAALGHTKSKSHGLDTYTPQAPRYLKIGCWCGLCNFLRIVLWPKVRTGIRGPSFKRMGICCNSILIFSGFLLFTWAISGIWGSTKRKLAAASEIINSLKLSQDEVNLLYFLGEHPSEPLNLDRVNYEAISLARLEVLDLVHNLKKKGLVSLNPYSSSELVSLTSSGRQRALEIQRASKAKAV